MANTRNTKQKQYILHILEASNRPMSINEIHTSCVDAFPKIAKSTVYRTIDALIKQDLIDKYYLNDNELFYQIRNHVAQHKHYVICNRCKKIFDLPICPVHDIEASLSEYGFTITDHYIQINGTCKDCRSLSSSSMNG